MKYLSLFTGIGGFEKGIEQAYENYRSKSKAGDKIDGYLWESSGTAERNSVPVCIGYSEIDKYACQIYDDHFDHHNYGDISKIDAEELPDFDLLVGGFPCQSFSIAGKRGGFDDTRGTLFFDIARIAAEKRPQTLLLENVKGLLSHDKGCTFGTILSTLDEMGYDAEWEVLNSKNFGVPQNRERVFIVGHLRGQPRPQVFPLGESNSECAGKDAQGNDVAYCLQAGGGRRQPFIAAQRGRYNEEGKTEQKFEPRKDNVTNTLTGVEKDNNVVFGASIRRLTPLECERLQGFPDGWTEGVSDTQRYKTLGNAVTVNVVQAVMERMI